MLLFALGIDQDVINEDHDTKFIRYMKCVGALVSPNDITKYS
jgi:hypothetical protein